ncbi:MAG: penicillin-binding transpeptidase domain-containing protein [Oscillospiraceae bacterium]|nr:penicillin-binding transpeptidase domain-containing protein [Oscillospiraceae bacterium]
MKKEERAAKILLHRVLVFGGLLLLIVGVFVYRLLDYQIVNGDDYLEQAAAVTTIRVSIPAARGDITDRNGNILATNRAGYNLQLNKLYLPSEKLNETLVDLVQLLQQNGENWNGDIPLSNTEPYVFLEGREDDVAALKKHFNLADYATAENVWGRMSEQYELENVPGEYRRIVAGIRYEMERREYSNVTPYLLASDVSIRTVTAVKEHSMEMPGVDVVEESIRYYPDGALLPHVLGRVGPITAEQWKKLKELGADNPYSMNDTIGQGGLEEAFEDQLRGKDGVMEILRAKDGSILSTRVVKEPVPGKTLRTTIDKDLQIAAQKALEDNMAYIQARTNGAEGNEGASVVVVDPQTFGVLALANYPTYDLNKLSTNYNEYLNMEQKPLFNRALMGLYRPGSSFKTAVGLTGLLKGEIEEESLVNCTGTYTYWADVGFTPKCLHVDGPINVVRALQVSCNIFFYDVGRRLGYEAFNDVANQLGLGVKTGVEVGEETGNLSSPEVRDAIIQNQKKNDSPTSDQWQAGNVVQAAIGQMDTAVTPVQLATYAASLANKGVRYKTHFVSGLDSYDYDPEKSVTFEAELMAQVENANGAFETVEKGMVMASKYGINRDVLRDYRYTIASKTGTAQVQEKKYNCTMLAYGPVKDPENPSAVEVTPELAVGVVIENCGNSYWLDLTVRDVFEAYYQSKEESTAPRASGVLLP